VKQPGRGAQKGVALKTNKKFVEPWLVGLPSDDLSCYDTLEEETRWWSHNWDDLLYVRSVYELLRDRLNADQQADLEQIDAWWHEHPEAFDATFAERHAYVDRRTALQGFGGGLRRRGVGDPAEPLVVADFGR